MSTTSFGKQGESAAVSFLKKKRFKIIEQNFRTRNGEIDIIAQDPSTSAGPVLVFIEVKTRSTEQFGTPFEAITPAKLRFIARTAEYYKATHERLPDLLRIDAVAVTFLPSGEVATIEHLINVGM